MGLLDLLPFRIRELSLASVLKVEVKVGTVLGQGWRHEEQSLIPGTDNMVFSTTSKGAVGPSSLLHKGY